MAIHKDQDAGEGLRRLVVSALTCVLIPALATLLSGQVLAKKESAMHVTKPSDREIVLTRTFAAPRQTVFETLTQAKHLVQWMKPTHFSLVTCEVDLRTGGSFRYVFQRPGGAKIEVRGVYEMVDPPGRIAYTESYDFSPLRVQVTTTLDQAGRSETVFTQTMVYASKQERDNDFDGVATSATEVYASLERYLGSSR